MVVPTQRAKGRGGEAGREGWARWLAGEIAGRGDEKGQSGPVICGERAWVCGGGRIAAKGRGCVVVGAGEPEIGLRRRVRRAGAGCECKLL